MTVKPFVSNKSPLASVFRHFTEGLEEIDFLPAVGTTVTGQRKIKAIVKAKMGLKRASQLRRTSSDLTVHCFPEDFADVVNIQDVLHSAIRWQGRNYSLDGVTVGKNYATGEIEHYSFNCSLAVYTDDRPKFCLEKSRATILVAETGRMFMVEQFGDLSGEPVPDVPLPPEPSNPDPQSDVPVVAMLALGAM